MAFFKFSFSNEISYNCLDCINSNCSKIHAQGLCIDLTKLYTINRDCMHHDINCISLTTNTSYDWKGGTTNASGWEILALCNTENDVSRLLGSYQEFENNYNDNDNIEIEKHYTFTRNDDYRDYNIFF